MFMGSWFVYEIAGFAFSDNLSSVRLYGASSLAVSMWFILFFSTFVVSFGPLEIGYRATRVFDSGWIEHFDAQSLYWFLFNLGKVNQWFQYSNLKVFFGVFVMWIVILLFIFIYYLNSLWFRARHWRCRLGIYCL